MAHLADRRSVLGTATTHQQICLFALEVPAEMEQRLGEAALQARADIGALFHQTSATIEAQGVFDRLAAALEEQTIREGGVQTETGYLDAAVRTQDDRRLEDLRIAVGVA